MGSDIMKDLALSVIIPTFNRKEVLKKCLNALFNQTYPKSDYEIIVIDDGSTDSTEEMVKSAQNQSTFQIRYFKQINKGPAAARNVGIKNANGKIVLFIGDDIIATPNLLEKHAMLHTKYNRENIAILGYVTWSSELKVTPFMHWLENGGPQFHYHQIWDKNQVSYKYFYTSNISLKISFIKMSDLLFDETYPYAAYEDIEFGYRLQTKGMEIYFNKSAIAYHFHPTTVKQFCRRQEYAGRNSVLLDKKLNYNSPLPNNNKHNTFKYLKIKIKPIIVHFSLLFINLIDFFNFPLPQYIYGFLTGHFHQRGIKNSQNSFNE